MNSLVRYGVSALCFGLLVYAFITMPFGERGYHFIPEADAEEREASAGERDDYDLSKLRILTRCVGYVRSYYVDPARIEPREMLVGALEQVQRSVPPLLVKVARAAEAPALPTSLSVTVYDQQREFDLTRVADLYEMNWKLLDIFEFIEERLKKRERLPEVEYAAINGMLETLDPHSVMLSPEVYREMKLGTSGEFGGLGIVISIRDGRLTIVSVIEDTPAYHKGLKRGDLIVQIGEESTVNMSLNEAVTRLRGEPGTHVSVWIARDGWPEPRAFDIARANIAIKSVVAKPLGRGVGYVRIKHFQQNTFSDLKTELARLKTSGHWRGLILDLRDNPGGLLEQAVLVSDAFIAEGTIVTTVGSGNKIREEKKATEAETLGEIPLVALVNRGSASASEIVAGALKNGGRALVIGDRTFGKGSVQVLYDIEDAALKLTIAQYLTPGDRSIQSVGIVPDVLTLPAVVRSDRVDLFWTDRESSGERDLPKHLEHRSARDDRRPEVILKYLLEEDEEEDGEKEELEDLPRARREEEDERYRRDKTVRFAESLLTRVEGPGREHMLAVAREQFSVAAREEGRAIRRELQKLGVAGRAAGRATRSGAPPRLEVQTFATPADGNVAAGGTISFRVVVTNRGGEAVHRVHAITRSEADRFDGLEFVFGRIPPGESREWTVPVKISRAARRRQDEVYFDVFSDGRVLHTGTVLPVEVVALPRPDFAFGVQVRDEAGGNGDGLVQRGERFGLQLTVHNQGRGRTFDVTATVKNLSGEAVFIHEGRGRFADLEPGRHAAVDFDLEVKPTLAEDTLKLEINVIDTTLRIQLKRRVTLAVGAFGTGGRQAVAFSGRIRSADTWVHGGASDTTGALGLLARGDVLDCDGTAGAFVRVRLAEGAWGWVAEGSLQRLGEREPTHLRFSPSPHVVPAVIRFDEASVAQTRTEEDGVTVAASVRFPPNGSDAPRFVYVYRNEEKLAFEEHAPVAGHALEVPVRVRVPLEPGQNRITLFAAEGDEPPVLGILLVRRDGDSPPAPTEVR